MVVVCQIIKSNSLNTPSAPATGPFDPGSRLELCSGGHTLLLVIVVVLVKDVLLLLLGSIQIEACCLPAPPSERTTLHPLLHPPSRDPPSSREDLMQYMGEERRPPYRSVLVLS